LIKRDVPEKSSDNLLIETWNIEKLGSKGVRRRKGQDHELIAELIKPFVKAFTASSGITIL
jgi:hypothetical protein